MFLAERRAANHEFMQIYSIVNYKTFFPPKRPERPPSCRKNLHKKHFPPRGTLRFSDSETQIARKKVFVSTRAEPSPPPRRSAHVPRRKTPAESEFVALSRQFRSLRDGVGGFNSPSGRTHNRIFCDKLNSFGLPWIQASGFPQHYAPLPPHDSSAIDPEQRKQANNFIGVAKPLDFFFPGRLLASRETSTKRKLFNDSC